MRDDIIVSPQAARGGTHAWTAKCEGRRVGSLQVDENKTIMLICVDPEYRRRGVATALYQAAVDALGVVWHDSIAHCTTAGYTWGQRVGGPRREPCACCPPVVVAYAATPARPSECPPPGAVQHEDEDGYYYLFPTLLPYSKRA